MIRENAHNNRADDVANQAGGNGIICGRHTDMESRDQFGQGQANADNIHEAKEKT